MARFYRAVSKMRLIPNTLAQLQDATHKLENQIHNMKDESHG